MSREGFREAFTPNKRGTNVQRSTSHNIGNKHFSFLFSIVAMNTTKEPNQDRKRSAEEPGPLPDKCFSTSERDADPPSKKAKVATAISASPISQRKPLRGILKSPGKVLPQFAARQDVRASLTPQNVVTQVSKCGRALPTQRSPMAGGPGDDTRALSACLPAIASGGEGSRDDSYGYKLSSPPGSASRFDWADYEEYTEPLNDTFNRHESTHDERGAQPQVAGRHGNRYDVRRGARGYSFSPNRMSALSRRLAASPIGVSNMGRFGNSGSIGGRAQRKPKVIVQTQYGPALLLDANPEALGLRKATPVVSAATARPIELQSGNRKFQRWSDEEDAVLRMAVDSQSDGQYCWKTIAKKYFGDTRTASQCKSRWSKALQHGIKRGKWTSIEDMTIVHGVENGLKWTDLAEHMPGRLPEHIRERYTNHLDKSLKKTPWTEEETKILFTQQRILGNRWTEIAKMLPGRSENSVKNRWHNAKTSQRRLLRRQAMLHMEKVRDERARAQGHALSPARKVQAGQTDTNEARATPKAAIKPAPKTNASPEKDGIAQRVKEGVASGSKAEDDANGKKKDDCALGTEHRQAASEIGANNGCRHENVLKEGPPHALRWPAKSPRKLKTVKSENNALSNSPLQSGAVRNKTSEGPCTTSLEDSLRSTTDRNTDTPISLPVPVASTSMASPTVVHQGGEETEDGEPLVVTV